MQSQILINQKVELNTTENPIRERLRTAFCLIKASTKLPNEIFQQYDVLNEIPRRVAHLSERDQADN